MADREERTEYFQWGRSGVPEWLGQGCILGGQGSKGLLSRWRNHCSCYSNQSDKAFKWIHMALNQWLYSCPKDATTSFYMNAETNTKGKTKTKQTKKPKTCHDIKTWFYLHLWYSNCLIINFLVHCVICWGPLWTFSKGSNSAFWELTHLLMSPVLKYVNVQVGLTSINTMSWSSSPRYWVGYGGWSEFRLVQERDTL